MEQLPKPYDITAIPYFPYTPGIWAWGLLLLAALALFILLQLWIKRGSKKRLQLNRFSWATSEINELLNDNPNLTTSSFEKAAIVIKRLIEANEGIAIATLSPSELKSLQDQFSSPVQDIIKLLIEWSEFKYCAKESPLPNRTNIEDALRLISEYEKKVVIGKAEKNKV